MKKICCACGKEKDTSEFGAYAKNKDGLQSKCKSCKREYDNAYYRDQPGRPEQIRASNAARTLDAQVFVWDYLLEHPCVDCGEPDPIVLDFDHLRDKDRNISKLVSQGVSLAKIADEIEKCEVRCANCHRRVTAKRAGWYSYVNMPC